MTCWAKRYSSCGNAPSACRSDMSRRQRGPQNQGPRQEQHASVRRRDGAQKEHNLGPDQGVKPADPGVGHLQRRALRSRSVPYFRPQKCIKGLENNMQINVSIRLAQVIMSRLTSSVWTRRVVTWPARAPAPCTTMAHTQTYHETSTPVDTQTTPTTPTLMASIEPASPRRRRPSRPGESRKCAKSAGTRVTNPTRRISRRTMRCNRFLGMRGIG